MKSKILENKSYKVFERGTYAPSFVDYRDPHPINATYDYNSQFLSFEKLLKGGFRPLGIKELIRYTVRSRKTNEKAGKLYVSLMSDRRKHEEVDHNLERRIEKAERDFVKTCEEDSFWCRFYDVPESFSYFQGNLIILPKNELVNRVNRLINRKELRSRLIEGYLMLTKDEYEELAKKYGVIKMNNSNSMSQEDWEQQILIRLLNDNTNLLGDYRRLIASRVQDLYDGGVPKTEIDTRMYIDGTFIHSINKLLSSKEELSKEPLLRNWCINRLSFYSSGSIEGSRWIGLKE